MNRPKSLTIHVHREGGQDLWADVEELPGCFASGRDMNELREALDEAVSLYLSEPGTPCTWNWMLPRNRLSSARPTCSCREAHAGARSGGGVMCGDQRAWERPQSTRRA